MTPPSLRRRAPSKVELTDSAGQPPCISHGLVHLRAGKRLRIRIVPQQSVPVTIVPSEALLTVVQPYAVHEGSVQVYHAEVVGRHRARWSLPRQAHIHITLADPNTEPYTLAIVVAVWPSIWGVLGTGVLGLGLLAVGYRFGELIKTRSPAETLLDLVTDTSFLGQTLLMGLAAAAVIHLLGWGAVRLGFLAGEEG